MTTISEKKIYQFNTQELLFASSPAVTESNDRSEVSEQFYSDGWCLLDDIKNENEAVNRVSAFIKNVDADRLPFLASLKSRTKLAKADQIPVCCDSVKTGYQALHFDMGQPLVSDEDQTMYTVIGLYCPMNKLGATAETRVLPLGGLFDKLTSEKLEKRLASYIDKYGDGWEDTNTGRLQCFARVVDAVMDGKELSGAKDQTMAEWFRRDTASESLKAEQEFYEKNGLQLEKLEKRVQLKPGQLMIIDNLRTVHGRIGRRGEKEIFQLMFGVESVTPLEISEYRNYLSGLLTE